MGLGAQERVGPTCPPQESCPPSEPSWSGGWSGHLEALAANVLVGGLTGGIGQWRGEGSFWRGLWRGGLGGAGTYLGKRLVAGNGPAPAVVGRAVGAAGSSMSRNAADGLPLLERLVLPVGPIRLHLRPREGNVRASVDLFTVGAIAYPYLSSMDASLDLSQSIYSGALVFMASDWEAGWGWHGRHVGGNILVRGDAIGPGFLRQILAHERVHLVQYDQAHILWGDALEGRILRWVGLGDPVTTRVDVSLLSMVLSASTLIVPHDWLPWEIEAHVFAETFPH
jgi:hypothetical protein